MSDTITGEDRLVCHEFPISARLYTMLNEQPQLAASRARRVRSCPEHRLFSGRRQFDVTACLDMDPPYGIEIETCCEADAERCLREIEKLALAGIPQPWGEAAIEARPAEFDHNLASLISRWHVARAAWFQKGRRMQSPEFEALAPIANERGELAESYSEQFGISQVDFDAVRSLLDDSPKSARQLRESLESSGILKPGAKTNAFKVNFIVHTSTMIAPSLPQTGPETLWTLERF